MALDIDSKIAKNESRGKSVHSAARSLADVEEDIFQAFLRIERRVMRRITEKRQPCRNTAALLKEQILNCIGAQNASLIERCPTGSRFDLWNLSVCLRELQTNFFGYFVCFLDCLLAFSGFLRLF